MHPRVLEVTERLVERSRKTRERYLAMMAAAASEGPQRGKLQCANFAHGVAGCTSGQDKQRLRLMNEANVAIVSAYNDMLSAHQLRAFPRTDQAGAARDRLGGPVRRRRAGHVRRRDPGRGGHGDEPGQPRSDRHEHCGGAVAQHVRRRVDARHLRQDRPRPDDRRATLRPPADGLRAGRADAVGYPQQGKGRGAPALCRGQGQPRGAVGIGDEVLPQPRHLHLLRHRQHQPGGDGDHGPAPAGRLLRQSLYPPARRPDPRGGATGDPVDRASRQLHAAVPDRRRESHRQFRGRAQRHRRLDQPYPAHSGLRPRRRYPADLAGHGRSFRSGTDAGQGLSQRPGRRESFPCLRRRAVHGANPARRRAAARGRAYRGWQGPAALHPGAVPRWRQAGLARRPAAEPRREHPAPGRATVFSRGWPAAAGGQPGPRRDQGVRRGARAPRGRGAGAGVRRPGRTGGGLQGRRTGARFRRRGAFPGAEGQRHAGVAQAHAVPRGAAGSRVQGGAGHRWAHVRGVGQGPGGDPRLPRGARWRAAGAGARRRHHPGRRRNRRAHGAGGSGRVGRAGADRSSRGSGHRLRPRAVRFMRAAFSSAERGASAFTESLEALE
ncbi:phosphogluconate dehydratase [Pseudomonas sp. BAY1663]|nr:phosphogluconate dehydratase [Pseudomonas sp. BAY1663]